MQDNYPTLVESPDYLKLIGSFNQHQKSLYRRALLGLGGCSFFELRQMCRQKKKRIKRVNQRALQILNILKQERIIADTFSLMTMFLQEPKKEQPKIQPGSNLAWFIDTYAEPDPDFHCSVTSAALGITQKEIIQRFIETGILPKEFYNLKNQEWKEENTVTHVTS